MFIHWNYFMWWFLFLFFSLDFPMTSFCTENFFDRKARSPLKAGNLRIRDFKIVREKKAWQKTWCRVRWMNAAAAAVRTWFRYTWLSRFLVYYLLSNRRRFFYVMNSSIQTRRIARGNSKRRSHNLSIGHCKKNASVLGIRMESPSYNHQVERFNFDFIELYFRCVV